MYRGSTDLLQRSARVFEPILEYLVNLDSSLWTLDVPAYTRDSTKSLMDSYDGLATVLQRRSISPTPTLRTKILLGTLGSLPAFDELFSRGTGMWRPTANSLMRLKSFYEAHKSMLDGHEIPCINFHAGSESVAMYTTAKKLDMIFFQRGLESGRQSK